MKHTIIRFEAPQDIPIDSKEVDRFISQLSKEERERLVKLSKEVGMGIKQGVTNLMKAAILKEMENERLYGKSTKPAKATKT